MFSQCLGTNRSLLHYLMWADLFSVHLTAGQDHASRLLYNEALTGLRQEPELEFGQDSLVVLPAQVWLLLHRADKRSRWLLLPHPHRKGHLCGGGVWHGNETTGEVKPQNSYTSHCHHSWMTGCFTGCAEHLAQTPCRCEVFLEVGYQEAGIANPLSASQITTDGPDTETWIRTVFVRCCCVVSKAELSWTQWREVSKQSVHVLLQCDQLNYELRRRLSCV